MFIPSNGFDTQTFVIETDISDHLPIALTCSVTENTNLSTSYKYRVLTDLTIDLFKSKLALYDWSSVYSTQTAESACHELVSALSNTYNATIPIKTTTKRLPKQKMPWLTNQTKAEMRVKNILFRRWRQTPSSEQWQTYVQQRKKVRRLLRADTYSYYTKLFEVKLAGDSKAFWDQTFKLTAHKFKRGSNQIEQLITPNGLSSDNFRICETLNTHFATVGATIHKRLQTSKAITPFPTLLTPRVEQTLNIPEITHVGIDRLFKTVKSNWKGAIYGPPSALIAHAKSELSNPIMHCFNLCIRQSCFPSCFKTAIITPLHKKGNRSDPANKRPISSTPYLAKLLERHLLDIIAAFVYRQNILHPLQFAFQKGRGTIHGLTHYINTITAKIDQRKKVTMLSLDIEKAYDSVHHRFLLHKLEHYGLRGNTLNLVHDYLSNRTIRTFCNNTLSDPAVPTVGIPQGTLLSPMFFILYLNDLLALNSTFAPNDIGISAYADDTIISFPLNTDFNSINCALARIHDWFAMNLLQLNCEKTTTMVFHSRGSTVHLPSELAFANTPLCTSQTQQIKILGIHFTPTLSWNTHINHVCHSLSFVNSLLFKLTMRCVPRRYVIRVYKALFLPCVIYGLSCWGFTTKRNLKRIQTLQNTAIRIIWGVGRAETVRPLLKQHGLAPLGTLRFYLTTTFIHQCVTNPDLQSVFQNTFTYAQNSQCRTRDEHTLNLPGPRLECRKNSIFFRGIQWYNTLPKLCREDKSFRSAKKKIRKYCYEDILQFYSVT